MPLNTRLKDRVAGNSHTTAAVRACYSCLYIHVHVHDNIVHVHDNIIHVHDNIIHVHGNIIHVHDNIIHVYVLYMYYMYMTIQGFAESLQHWYKIHFVKSFMRSKYGSNRY